MRTLTKIFLVCATLLHGCANISVVDSFDSDGWTQYAPRAPQTPLEAELVALTESSAVSQDFTLYYVFRDSTARYLDVVRHPADPWKEKSLVTHYRVVGDKITASTGEQEELYPNLDFQRSVVNTARMAFGLDRVMIYLSDEHPMAFSSRPMSFRTRCLASVRICTNADNNQEVLDEKLIRFCFD